jgi:hypothetical protein
MYNGGAVTEPLSSVKGKPLTTGRSKNVMLNSSPSNSLIGTIMFDKESLQNDIDDISTELTNIKGSFDCLEESDSLDDIWTNLENISDEAAKLANLAESLLSRVKAIKMG